jgi:hypothetical protein
LMRPSCPFCRATIHAIYYWNGLLLKWVGLVRQDWVHIRPHSIIYPKKWPSTRLEKWFCCDTQSQTFLNFRRVEITRRV